MNILSALIVCLSFGLAFATTTDEQQKEKTPQSEATGFPLISNTSREVLNTLQANSEHVIKFLNENIEIPKVISRIPKNIIGNAKEVYESLNNNPNTQQNPTDMNNNSANDDNDKPKKRTFKEICLSFLECYAQLLCIGFGIIVGLVASATGRLNAFLEGKEILTKHLPIWCIHGISGGFVGLCVFSLLKCIL